MNLFADIFAGILSGIFGFLILNYLPAHMRTSRYVCGPIISVFVYLFLGLLVATQIDSSSIPEPFTYLPFGLIISFLLPIQIFMSIRSIRNIDGSVSLKRVGLYTLISIGVMVLALILAVSYTRLSISSII